MATITTDHVDPTNASLGLQAAIDKAQPGDTVLLRPGRLRLSKTLRLVGKPGVTIQGTPVSVLVKGWAPTYGNAAVLRLELANQSRLLGFGIEGSTPEAFPLWNDDGVHILESVDVLADDLRVHGCGDAGLRVCGSASNLEQAPGVVTTRDIRVQNCTISEIYQTSTTPNGVAGYHFVNNTIRGLYGSVKFASRNNGAGRLLIMGNNIKGAPTNRQGGLEISGYQELVVAANIITDCGGDAAVHLHVNEHALVPEAVKWRDAVIAANIFLRNNGTVVIRDAVTGAKLAMDGSNLS